MTALCHRSLAALAALAVTGIAAAPADATPVASTPPAISGTATYGSTLTCANGGWSTGAGSFSYTWQLADGNVQIGAGSTLRVRAAWVGSAIVCAVTATDSTGTTTAVSPPVTAQPAAVTITITAARQTTSKTIELAGKITPTASLNGGASSLILYRQTNAGLLQLSFTGNQTRPNRSGAFRMVAQAQPVARSTYVLVYVPSALGFPSQVVVTRKIRVRS